MRPLIRLFFVLIWLACISSVVAEPVISEFMASNKKTLKDEDGDAPDWLEIRNPDAVDVDLSGWSLTDTASNPRQWVFPAVTIPARGYLLVYCSSKDRRVPGKPLHTNFDLKAGGEYLALIKPDGVTKTTEFSPTFPAQYQDISYGTSSNVNDVAYVTKTSTVRAFIPANNTLGATWHARTFADASWLTGAFAVGFMNYNATSVPNLQADLGLDLKTQGITGTGRCVYQRVHFTVANPALVTKLVLQASYDDGFYAWLNGTTAASSPSAPAESALVYNSLAPNHSPGAFETFDVSAQASALVAGDNVLALQSLNTTTGSSDIYMSPVLVASVTNSDPTITGYFSVATPGAANGGQSTIMLPQTITASRASGTFTAAFNLTLTGAGAGQVIRYNIADPSANPGAGVADPTIASTAYTGAISVASSKLIRAAVFDSSTGQKGPTQTLQYLLLDTTTTSTNTSNFTSAMPIIVADDHGAGQPVDSDTNTHTATMLYTFPTVNGTASLNASPSLVTRAGLDVRGSSSKDFPKKSYGLRTYTETGSNNSVSLLGMASDSNWILNGPWTYDDTDIHNAFMYELSRQCGRWAPRTQFVEMFLNSNGGLLDYTDYAGIYVLTEKIKPSSDRLPITEMSAADNNGDAVTGGYIFKIDLPDTGEIAWQTANGVPDPSFGGQKIVLTEPDEGSATVPQIAYIRDSYVASFDATLFSEKTAGFTTRNYRNYIDLPSFIDYHILNSLAYNVDGMRRSAYYFKDRDQKINAGPLWDYDRSLNTDDGRAQNPQSWNNIAFDYFSDDWWGQLFQDPDFVQAWIDRWGVLRAGPLATANMTNIVSALSAQVSAAAVARDWAKWPDNKPLNGIYADEINDLKTYITTRAAWLDGQMPAPGTASRASGTVAAGSTYTIDGAGSPVYYTLDGSDPRAVGGGTSSGAQLYSNALTVSRTTTIISRRYFATAVSPFPGATSTHWGPPIVTVLLVNDAFAVAGDLAVSEINYNPTPPTAAELAAAPGVTADDFEFVELRNIGSRNVNTFEVKFADGQPFKELKLAALTLAPGEYALAVRNRAAFLARYGAAMSGRIVGEWVSGVLSNGGEAISLLARDGTSIQNFTYSDSGVWPGRADGKGSTLEYIGATYANVDYNNGANWRASSELGGSPGAAGAGPDARVVINEVLSHSNTPRVDAIELYNTTGTPIDLGGWFICDDVGTPATALDYAKFRIPDGTTIPAFGYRVYTEVDFNPNGIWNANAGTPAATEFAFDAHKGDDAWLIQGSAGLPVKFVDHLSFGGARSDESFGRWPNGTGALYPMLTRTLLDENSSTYPRPGLGALNSRPRVGPLFISEVQHSPVSGNANLQYVEIANAGTTTQSLAHWLLDGGVTYAFGNSDSLAPGGILVVVPFSPTADTTKTAAFRSTYSLASSVPLVGPWTKNAGLTTASHLVLYRADSPSPDAPNFYPLLTEDETHFLSVLPWPSATGGPALCRRDFAAVGDQALSWKLDVPSPGTFGPTYAQWKAYYFPAGGAGSADAEDYDGDGASNALEYSRGTNPKVFEAQLALSPTLTPPGNAVGGSYTFTFVKPTDRPGARYAVQQSSDLLNWTNAADTLVSATQDMETHVVTVPADANLPPKLFFRLSITVSP